MSPALVSGVIGVWRWEVGWRVGADARRTRGPVPTMSATVPVGDDRDEDDDAMAGGC